MGLTSFLYRLARLSADTKAVAPGDPKRVERKLKNKLLGRAFGGAGVHPKVVSERLGHSTVSITLDTYSHSIPAMQADAAEKAAAMVFGR